MEWWRSTPSIIVFLQGWPDFLQLKKLHSLMITTSLISRTIPCSRLIDSLVDIGGAALDHARSIFLNSRQTPSLYIWNSMIRGLSGGPSPECALHLYAGLQRAGLSPDSFTYPFVLKACSAIAGLDHKRTVKMEDITKFGGKTIHARILKSGYEADVYVSATLIKMYAARDVDEAKLVFDSAQNRNVVSWTTMIAAYVEDGRRPGEALRLFDEMELSGERPNAVTWVHIISACGQTGDMETWRRVGDRLPRRAAALNVILGTALLDMYVQCGCLQEARQLFDGMRERNLVTCNAMIGAYNHYGKSSEAVKLYKRMSILGMNPDKVTLLNLLGTCREEGLLALGQSLHGYVEKTHGSSEDLALGTSLIFMYSNSGDAESGFRIFKGMVRRDAAAWTAMLTGLAANGEGNKAVVMFREMEEGSTSESLDPITFVAVLSACGHAGMVEEGRRFFQSMISKYGFEPEVEHYGCIIDMLGRAGYGEEAARLGMKVAAEFAGELMWNKGVKKAAGISSLIPLS